MVKVRQRIAIFCIGLLEVASLLRYYQVVWVEVLLTAPTSWSLYFQSLADNERCRNLNGRLK